MIVYNNINDVQIQGRTVVALGTFDGIHTGHRQIIESAVRIANEKGISSVCYTFSTIPLNYIKGIKAEENGAIHYICSEEMKLKLMEEIGIDILVNVPFDSNIMNMKANDFIDNIIFSTLHADTVCCGFNYTFGAHAEGDVKMLAKEGNRIGMSVAVHDAVKSGDDVISSTLIRSCIREGQIKRASQYLGRFYTLAGTVRHGNRIGTGIGFPTINIDSPAEMEQPPNGVYFTLIDIDGVQHKGITNIGTRPTVDGSKKYIETHVFDYSGNAYEKTVELHLLSFERAEKKFDSVEELRLQIAADSMKARAFHNINNINPDLIDNKCSL